MKVYVRLGVLEAPEPLREYTLRKIHLQLSRFGREISAVSVRLSDVNGPKGGEDIRCHLGLHGPNLGTISIDERSTEATVAIDMAADRAARIAGRELERARSPEARDPRLVRPRQLESRAPTGSHSGLILRTNE